MTQPDFQIGDSGHVAHHNALKAGKLDVATASATYAPAFPTLAVTYDSAGNPLTVTEDAITTTYTYNTDGTVATATRQGVTKTYAYSGGNLTAVA